MNKKSGLDEKCESFVFNEIYANAHADMMNEKHTHPHTRIECDCHWQNKGTFQIK